MSEFDHLIEDLRPFKERRERADEANRAERRGRAVARMAKSIRPSSTMIQPFPSAARPAATPKRKPSPVVVVRRETTDELHARVRSGAADIMAKATGAFEAGKIGGAELIRVEASVNAVLAQIP